MLCISHYTYMQYTLIVPLLYIYRYHATERARLRQDNNTNNTNTTTYNTTNNTTNNNKNYIYSNIRVPALSYHDESSDVYSYNNSRIQQYTSTDSTLSGNSSTVPTTVASEATTIVDVYNAHNTNNTHTSNSDKRVYTTHIYPTQIYPYIDDIHNYTHNTTAYKKRRICNTTTANIYDTHTTNNTHTNNNDNSILISEQYDTIQQACYNLQALKSSQLFQA